MALSLTAIDRVFARLTAAYGRQFLDLYADLSPQDVKTAWAHELEDFGTPGGMKRIAMALDNLPDKAPNAPAFRNLCRQMRVPDAPALPMPAANPERMKAELAKLGHIEKAKRMPNGVIDHKAWAKALKARDEAGEKLNPTVRRFYREALRAHLDPAEA